MELCIAILGNSGSGKSTLARELACRFQLPALDLDAVAWVPGKVAIAQERNLALAEVAAFCQAQPGWIVEGCYAGLVQAALDYKPRLIFLDPGVEVCLAHCRSRPWEPHKYASRKEQDEKLAFLLDWVEGYETREGELSRRGHQALFERYPGPKYRIGQRVDEAFLGALPDFIS